MNEVRAITSDDHDHASFVSTTDVADPLYIIKIKYTKMKVLKILFIVLLYSTIIVGQDEQIEIDVDTYEYIGNTMAFPFEINRVNNSTSSLMLGTGNDLYAAIAGNNVGIRFGRYFGNDDTFHEHYRTTQLGLIGIGTSAPSELVTIRSKTYSKVNNSMEFSLAINRVNTETQSLMLGTDQDLNAVVAGNNIGIRFGRYFGNDDSFHEHFRTTQLGNFGIGTNDPKSKLQIKDGDIYIEDVNSGIILTSPDENCWRMTVDNTGNPIFSPINCP